MELEELTCKRQAKLITVFAQWSLSGPDATPAAAAGKAECKAALQRELGLPEDARVPLLGFIGRLDFQKVYCFKSGIDGVSEMLATACKHFASQSTVCRTCIEWQA